MPRKRRFSEEPFGPTTTALMDEGGITYRGLAAKSGLSAGYLNHIVHGNRPVPANDVIERLAKALERRARALPRVPRPRDHRAARGDAGPRRPSLQAARVAPTVLAEARSAGRRTRRRRAPRSGGAGRTSGRSSRRGRSCRRSRHAVRRRRRSARGGHTACGRCSPCAMTTALPNAPRGPAHVTSPDPAASTAVPAPTMKSTPAWKASPRGPKPSPTGASTGARSLIGLVGIGLVRAAAIVSGPASPICGSPRKRWKRVTAAASRLPYAPSNGPEGKPCHARRNWSSATSQPDRAVRQPAASERVLSVTAERAPRARADDAVRLEPGAALERDQRIRRSWPPQPVDRPGIGAFHAQRNLQRGDIRRRKGYGRLRRTKRVARRRRR